MISFPIWTAVLDVGKQTPNKINWELDVLFTQLLWYESFFSECFLSLNTFVAPENVSRPQMLLSDCSVVKAQAWSSLKQVAKALKIYLSFLA